jgi:hypothetical protein
VRKSIHLPSERPPFHRLFRLVNVRGIRVISGVFWNEFAVIVRPQLSIFVRFVFL